LVFFNQPGLNWLQGVFDLLLHACSLRWVKLVKKERRGSRYRKVFDKAKTPYQRVLEGSSIPQAEKDKLTTYPRKMTRNLDFI
jgi:hypothetical protein